MHRLNMPLGLLSLTILVLLAGGCGDDGPDDVPATGTNLLVIYEDGHRDTLSWGNGYWVVYPRENSGELQTITLSGGYEPTSPPPEVYQVRLILLGSSFAEVPEDEVVSVGASATDTVGVIAWFADQQAEGVNGTVRIQQQAGAKARVTLNVSFPGHFTISGTIIADSGVLQQT